MIHKVSVVKKIMFLLMTMALAVAMVACSGAAGTPGPAGPPGKDAPTPDPTTPTTPTTTPTTPTDPTGAAPEVTMMFSNVYLTLKGGRKTDSFEMSAHFNDVDSLLKYTLSSTDATVATAVEKNGTLTITAIKDGTATITVTASDDEGLSKASADIAVTVVKENAAPTTHGLNKTDRTNLLEKRLYYRDGDQTRTVTVVANPGAVVAGAAGSVTDSILVDDFKVVIGKAKANGDDDISDNKISVTVTKTTGAHSYSIVIDPNEDGFGGLTSQMVKIYPKDMFGAMVKDPWEFTAMYNPPPESLGDSFHIELERDATPANPDDPNAPNTADPDGDTLADRTGNIGKIVISEYFVLDSLEITKKPDTGADLEENDLAALIVAQDSVTVRAATAAERAKIDLVGDTVCTVSPQTGSYAVVMPLNEAGNLFSGAEIDHKEYLVTGDQALTAIRIDSRYSSLGTDMIVTATGDMKAIATGTFKVTISCTDKDATAIVEGTVVVRKGPATSP